MKNEKYIANGKVFYSYGEVEKYAQENGWRISNTEKSKGVHLVTLSAA